MQEMFGLITENTQQLLNLPVADIVIYLLGKALYLRNSLTSITV